MASAPTHAAVALALGACFPRAAMRPGTFALGAGLAVLPDIDAVGYWLGLPTRSLLGHRGLTHSLAFAALIGVTAALLFTRRGALASVRGWIVLYLVLAMASHGALDACTNGGPGIAFFSPFSNARHFFRFRPLAVSPIGVRGVFGHRGLVILASEARWVWFPAALLAGTATMLRRLSRRG